MCGPEFSHLIFYFQSANIPSYILAGISDNAFGGDQIGEDLSITSIQLNRVVNSNSICLHWGVYYIHYHNFCWWKKCYKHHAQFMEESKAINLSSKLFTIRLILQIIIILHFFLSIWTISLKSLPILSACFLI